MSSRIVTDEAGDRWDVREADDRSERGLVFRHQSGREIAMSAQERLDAIDSESLRRMVAEARRDIGEGAGSDTSLDPEGYTTN
jgi:hypothetical protein